MMRGDASGIPTESDGTVEGYEHLHPDIAAMLLADGSGSNAHFAVDARTLTLVRRDGPAIATTDTLQMDQLAGMADECDRAAFSVQIERDIPKKITGLIHLSRFPSSEICEDSGNSPAGLVASTVALNLLESSIRDATAGNRVANNNSNKSKGNASQKGAPLLRDMIEEISCMRPPSANDSGSNIAAADLAPILRALLLPTRVGGINLRNIATHGFLSRIDRRWFSLTLVLMQTLDKLQAGDAEKTMHDGERSSADASSPLRKYAPMESEVCRGKSILSDDSRLMALELELQGLVPATHVPLLRFSLHCLAPTLRSDDERTEGGNLIPALTAVFATTLCCVIEHSLRLLWCEHNNRPDDRIARPATYYVTLDGHGQRDKHDVMLALYLRDKRARNQLIPVMGAQACALLSDLFAAPANDAPNIRSALCHGYWNGELTKELEGLTSFHERSDAHPERSNQLLLDSACALVSCMDMVSASLAARSRTSAYRPVYSYTATAARSLTDVLRDLAKLEALISSNTFIRNCTKTMESEHSKLCGELKPFRVDTKVIEELVCSIFPSLGSDEVFNIDSIYREHETNLVLADNVVALALLSDASRATENYLDGLQERIDALPTKPKNTKERRMVKSASRYFSVAKVARDFYAWSVVVGLVAVRQSLHYETIEQGCSRNGIVKASERSRMALSTFDAYLAVNLDRSLKALQQYLNGKAVKQVLLRVNETKHSMLTLKKYE